MELDRETAVVVTHRSFVLEASVLKLGFPVELMAAVTATPGRSLRYGMPA